MKMKNKSLFATYKTRPGGGGLGGFSFEEVPATGHFSNNEAGSLPMAHGGMGCGSHPGTKKKKHSKNKRSKMRRGGMGCGSHHGKSKSHKKKHSRKRGGGTNPVSKYNDTIDLRFKELDHVSSYKMVTNGGMGCGSHHGKSKSHKKKHSKNKHSKKRRGGMGCGAHTKKRKHRKRK